MIDWYYSGNKRFSNELWYTDYIHGIIDKNLNNKEFNKIYSKLSKKDKIRLDKIAVNYNQIQFLKR